jgi:hypothetical protein
MLVVQAKDDHIVTSNTKIMSPTLGKRPRNEIDLCNIQEESPGEANVSGSVGSNEDVDLLDEDLLRNPESRATGFRGQNSEVQWLRSFKMNMGSPVSEKEDFQFAYGPPGTSDEAVQKRINAKHARMDTSKLGRILHVNDSNFYLDADHLEVDEFLVEPYQIPPDDTARALFQCYMDKVHSSFPILPELFEKNFEQYFELARMSQSVSVITKFQGILNLIFAIGAKYSHLTKADWATDERDHLLYMTRAIKLLGLNDTLNLIVAPDLGLIQVRLPTRRINCVQSLNTPRLQVSSPSTILPLAT